MLRSGERDDKRLVLNHRCTKKSLVIALHFDFVTVCLVGKRDF